MTKFHSISLFTSHPHLHPDRDRVCSQCRAKYVDPMKQRIEQTDVGIVSSLQEGFSSLAHSFTSADSMLHEKRDSLTKHEDLYGMLFDVFRVAYFGSQVPSVASKPNQTN